MGDLIDKNFKMTSLKMVEKLRKDSEEIKKITNRGNANRDIGLQETKEVLELKS